MLLYIIGGIILIISGLVQFKKPDLVWKLKYLSIDKPSDMFLLRTKMNGIVCILVGVLLIICFPIFLV